MKKLLVVMLAVLSIVSMVYAGWTYDSRLVDYNTDSTTYKFVGEINGVVHYANMPHGVVVDANGKIWVALYGAYGAHEGVHEFAYGAATSYFRPFYIYNSDGTIFKSVSVFELPDGTLDTLHSASYANGACRGISQDADGNILISSYSTLYRFDYQTFECTGRYIPATLASMTDAAHDATSDLYMIGHVGSGRPVHLLDENLEEFGTAIEALPSLQRSICIKSVDDGMDMYVGGIYSGRLYKYHTPDIEFDLFTIEDTVGTFEVDSVSYNMWAECLDWMPDGKLLCGNTRVSEYPNPKNHLWTIYDTETESYVGDFGNPVVAGEYDPLAIPGGATNSPRGASFIGDDVMYLADFTLNTVDKWVYVASSVNPVVANSFTLNQNYPNPFNAETTISYTIENDADVVVAIYNMKGQLIETLVNEHKAAGTHLTNWNAENVASGTYLYKVQVGNDFQTKKMVMMK